MLLFAYLALALSLNALFVSLYVHYNSIEHKIKRLEKERDLLLKTLDNDEEFDAVIKELNRLYKKRFPLIRSHLLDS